MSENPVMTLVWEDLGKFMEREVPSFQDPKIP
jgi:hypothetical protein